MTIPDLVQRALRDRAVWAEATSDEATRSAVYEELERIHRDVGAQMASRASDLATLRDDAANHRASDREYQEERRAYREWHASASRFRAMIDARMGEIKPLVAGTHRRLSVEADRYRELVNRLVKAIYQHQAEDITDADLYALLDITIPNGVHGERTLFDLAATLLNETKVPA